MDIFERQLKTHLFYNSLVCPPPSASVSKDNIGAMQIVVFSFF